MASTHAHVPQHVLAYHDLPPSPTLTNPDMILPFDDRHENFPSLTIQPSSTTVQSDVISNSSFDGTSPSTRPRGDSDAEVGIATAVALPMLVRGRVATTVAAAPLAVNYLGYEHGAPLSDIGEEAEETTVRSRSSSPSRSKSPSKNGPRLRHKQRLSNLSSSSNESDKNDQWERFDTSHLMSDRVAADIAQVRDAVNHGEDIGNRRDSKDMEEELAVLNERAESILENARKRLSSMEDNLTKARHSILLSPRSIPNMHELGHQPAGGLYRSISQNAHNRRSRGLFPSLKTMGLQHARTGSEMSPSTGLKRLSGVAEPRSASAMDFSPARYGAGFITPDLKVSPPTKFPTHSPSSSRSFNSPLHILSEEVEQATPSTAKTSPDTSIPSSSTFSQPRGLGIHASGTRAQEDLTLMRSESSESPNSLNRSSSQASTRSTRELRDQMSDMKNRIADLRNKAQSDTLRRRSLQSLRTPSPFLHSNVNGHGAEGWYTGAGPSNHEQPSTTPTGHPSNFWAQSARPGHERKDSALESITDQPTPPPQVVIEDPEAEVEQNPITPVAARLRNITDGTPIHPSSARTDRNTPNLVNRTVNAFNPTQGRQVTNMQEEQYEEAEQDIRAGEEEEEEEEIATSQEEQIYLNEVLEESLHDIEPEVPTIPGEYLIGDELVELQSEETERHEDRLDAFDYENMFLHSAMGTFRGDDDSDASDSDSLVTSREDVTTPTAGLEYEEQTTSGEDQSTSDRSSGRNSQPVKATPPTSPIYAQGTPKQLSKMAPQSPRSLHSETRSPLRENVNGRLQTPPQPWIGMGRTRSMDTLSSVASYRTATEGEYEYDDEDEDFHDEILNWGNAPAHHATTQQQNLPPHGVSAKAQNVLGWPAPPPAENGLRNSSQGRPQQLTLNGGHYRTASGNSARGSAGRSPLSNVQYSAFPFPATAPTQPPPTQPLPPPPPAAQIQPQSQNPAAVTHQANTEILMESLIKLADPEFSIESIGRASFADIDKELVLGLLRAVGGVCDGVLRAQNGRRGSVVKELRTRLMNAKEILVGIQEQEGLEEIIEDDEDGE